jgi:predicted acylesterase/phospholipase RssA
MGKSDVSDAPEDRAVRWWENGSLQADVAGVFEGGGAKGLAYAGAVAAVRDHGRWFSAVAGASAGAITAALIAAGANPEQLEAWTSDGMGTLAEQLALPPKSKRLARTRFAWRALHHLGSPTTAAVAKSDQLDTWLRNRFEVLVGDPNITFKGLYDATGIELTVVAVDLLRRKHRIFCHSWTPRIPVADAVLASSSIPFALPAQRLALADEHARSYGNPVVDGGVWTNFPTFVFHDHQFRAHHRLPPLGDRPVIGFLLDEEGDEPYVAARDVPYAFGRIPSRLTATLADGELRPAELLLSYDHRIIDDAIEHQSVRDRPRFTSPSLLQMIGDTTRVSGLRTTKRVPPSEPFDPVQQMRDGDRPSLDFLLLGLGMVANPYVMLALLVGTLVGSIGILREFFDLKPEGVGWTIAWGFGLVLTVIVVTSAFVLSVVLLVGHAATHWPIRKYGILLAATYTAGSGAPYWAGRSVDGAADHGVIRLPVPVDLTTMSFAIRSDRRAEIVRLAYDTTRVRLHNILRGEDPTEDAAASSPERL